jgi:hypothetical protein
MLTAPVRRPAESVGKAGIRAAALALAYKRTPQRFSANGVLWPVYYPMGQPPRMSTRLYLTSETTLPGGNNGDEIRTYVFKSFRSLAG